MYKLDLLIDSEWLLGKVRQETTRQPMDLLTSLVTRLRRRAHLLRYLATGSADFNLKSFRNPEKLKAGSPSILSTLPSCLLSLSLRLLGVPPSVSPALDGVAGVPRSEIAGTTRILAASFPAPGPVPVPTDGPAGVTGAGAGVVGVANGSNSDMSGPPFVVGVAEDRGVWEGSSFGAAFGEGASGGSTRIGGAGVEGSAGCVSVSLSVCTVCIEDEMAEGDGGGDVRGDDGPAIWSDVEPDIVELGVMKGDDIRSVLVNRATTDKAVMSG